MSYTAVLCVNTVINCFNPVLLYAGVWRYGTRNGTRVYGASRGPSRRNAFSAHQALDIAGNEDHDGRLESVREFERRRIPALLRQPFGKVYFTFSSFLSLMILFFRSN